MYIAIDIGGTKTRILGFKEIDLDTQIFSQVIDTDKSYIKHKKNIFKAIDSSVSKKIKGIGISMTGVIDSEKGKVLISVNLPGFQKKPILKDFKEKYKTDVKIENDTACAALAESLFGWGKNYEKTLYFTVSTGLGATFVYKHNGKFNIKPTELGHQVIKGSGIKCVCGQLDCIDSYIGGRSLETRFLKPPKDLNNLLLWESELKYLVTAVVNGIVIFDPDVLILGGGMIEKNDYVKEKLIAEIGHQLRVREVPTIKISKMATFVAANGALALLKD